MSTPAPTTAKRPRRWLQYSLRSLLALVVMASVGMAFWATYIRPYQVQHRARDKLAGLGAQLEFEPTGPAWLRRLAGEEFPVEIVMAKLDGKRNVKDKDLACLRDLRSLRRLYLGSTQVTDATLRRIARLKHLRRMSLWETSVTDQGMRSLGSLPELEVLDLNRNDLCNAGMEHLSRSKSLRWLNIDFNRRITAEGFGHLARISSLRELRFRGVLVPVESVAALGGSRIERFRVDGIHRDAVGHLASLTNLRELPNIAGEVITPQVLEQVRPLTRLEKLWLTPRYLRPGGTVHLLPFQNLEELTLCGIGKPRTQVTAEDITRLAGVPKLRSLDLQQANVDDEALRPIHLLTALRKLGLRRTQITDAGLVYVGKLTELEELDLYGTNVSDAGLAHLQNLTKLRRLTCSSKRVTDAGVDHLFGMTRMQRLDLCGTRLSGEKAEQFHAKVPGCYIEDNWCCGCMAIEPKR